MISAIFKGSMKRNGTKRDNNGTRFLSCFRPRAQNGTDGTHPLGVSRCPVALSRNMSGA